MSVIANPLFLIVLSSLVTWLACRWWYGRKTRFAEPPKARVEEPSRLDLPVAKSVGTPSPKADLEDVLRVASLGGAPLRPFLDTAPLTHVPETGPS